MTRQGTSNHKCLECGHEFTEFSNDKYSLSAVPCPKCGSGETELCAVIEGSFWASTQNIPYKVLEIKENCMTISLGQRYKEIENRPKLSFLERLKTLVVEPVRLFGRYVRRIITWIKNK